MIDFDNNVYSAIRMDLSGRYRSLQDIVYKELRDEILQGQLKPGDHLNTNQLSKVLNISRTPIREAINRLSEMGLVVRQDHMEARVAEFPLEEVYEYFYVRAFLEGLAGKIAARKMAPEDKLTLQKYMEQMKACINKPDESKVGDFFEINRKLHSLVFSVIKTPVLVSLWEQCYAITVRYRTFTWELAVNGQLLLDEHQRIVDCILAGDEVGAEDASLEHNRKNMAVLDSKLAGENI